MKRNHILALFVMSLLLLFAPGLPASADDALCISDIRIETGRDALGRLEEEGYTVVRQNLNPSGKRQSAYLGYRLGENAVTGLVVSKDHRSEIAFEGVRYALVSDENLGSEKKPLYLYATRDEACGSGIVSLGTLSVDPKNGGDPLDIFGDGSMPLRTDDGHAADLEPDASEWSLYLFAVPKDLCLPYISDLRIVTAREKKDLYDAVVSAGFNYYEEQPLFSTSEGDAYLCYNRTADPSLAVTFAAVSDASSLAGLTFESAGNFGEGETATELIYTKAAEVGSPVAGITVGERMSGSFTMGEWAAAYFGGSITSAKARLYQSAEYALLCASEETFMESPLKMYEGGKEAGETGLYLISSVNVIPLWVSEEETLPETEPLPGEENEEDLPNEEEAILPEEEIAEEELLSDGMVHDTEEEGFVREEEESETDTEEEAAEEDNTDEALGSAIGRGSLIAIAVLAISAVTAAFIAAMVRGNKGKKEE